MEFLKTVFPLLLQTEMPIVPRQMVIFPDHSPLFMFKWLCFKREEDGEPGVGNCYFFGFEPLEK